MSERGDLIRHYLISGRVQGVGFRAFTQRQARELRLAGWVRNLEDGRVEALARGPAETLASFESRLRQGPAHGRVDALVMSELTPAQGPRGDFEVREDGGRPCTD